MVEERFDRENDKDEIRSASPAVFGGGRYRLHYDKYTDTAEIQKPKAQSVSAKRTVIFSIVVIAVVAAFVIGGLLIYGYFSEGLRTQLRNQHDDNKVSVLERDEKTATIKLVS